MARTMRPQVKSAIQEESAAAQQLAPCDYDEVAKVAYSLFQQRGGTYGNDQQDWFEAERIVRQHRRGSSTRQASRRS